MIRVNKYKNKYYNDVSLSYLLVVLFTENIMRGKRIRHTAREENRLINMLHHGMPTIQHYYYQMYETVKEREKLDTLVNKAIDSTLIRIG